MFQFFSSDFHQQLLVDIVASHEALYTRSLQLFERLHDVNPVSGVFGAPPRLLDPLRCSLAALKQFREAVTANEAPCIRLDQPRRLVHPLAL